MAPIPDERHIAFMREALQMAEHILQSGETPVGDILVYKDEIVDRGRMTRTEHNTERGTRNSVPLPKC
jgi:tRNA(Arg) A34 adenosine deaminase TadA